MRPKVGGTFFRGVIFKGGHMRGHMQLANPRRGPLDEPLTFSTVNTHTLRHECMHRYN